MSGQDHKRDSNPDIGSFLLVLPGVPAFMLPQTFCSPLSRDGVCLETFLKEARPHIPDTMGQVLQVLHLGTEQFKSWVFSALCQWSFRHRIGPFRWSHHSSGLALSTQMSLWVLFLFFQYFFTLYEFPCLPLLFLSDNSCLNNSELVLETFYQLWLW